MLRVGFWQTGDSLNPHTLTLHRLLFFLTLLLIACDSDISSTERPRSETPTLPLESIAEVSQALQLEESLDNLIETVEEFTTDSILLHYEQGNQYQFSKDLLLSYVTDKSLWNVDFLFVDSSSVSADYLGSTLNSLEVALNPIGTAPLVARVSVPTSVRGKFIATVLGQDGIHSNITNQTNFVTKQHSVDILGLYANFQNSIQLTFLSPTGQQRLDTVIQVTTAQLPDLMPQIDIVKQYRSAQDNVVFLVNYKRTNIPFMVDRFGKIRWYSRDFSGVSKFGLIQLKNGNLMFGQNGSGQAKIIEYSLMGKKLNEFNLYPNYENIHHDIYELPNGNLLVTVDKVGISTIEDHVVEVNRLSGDVVTVWDLRQSLQTDRLNYRMIRNGDDWFHNNAVIYDARDHSIIVSGAAQGVAKLTWANKLKWILAPHEGWSRAFQPFLLNGPAVSASFDWNWGQHAPVLMPNGNLFLFDNGFGRNYETGTYSRAVEYKIVEKDSGGTVSQVWSYGENRGLAMFSPIVSDVDYLPETNSRLIVSGATSYVHSYTDSVNSSNQPNAAMIEARILEVSDNQDLLFEMTFQSSSTGMVYRAEKIRL